MIYRLWYLFVTLCCAINAVGFIVWKIDDTVPSWVATVVAAVIFMIDGLAYLKIATSR